MAKKYFWVFLILIFSVSVSWAMGEKPRTAAGAAIDFNLPDLSGKMVKLSAYRGQVVFLNFFATWCPPCREEMPSMQKLYNRLKGNKFEMLAVSLDRDGKAAVKPFVDKNGYTFKILLDPEGKAAARYGVVSIPTTFIVNKRGEIIDKIIGGRDWSEEAVIKRLSEEVQNGGQR